MSSVVVVGFALLYPPYPTLFIERYTSTPNGVLV